LVSYHSKTPRHIPENLDLKHHHRELKTRSQPIGSEIQRGTHKTTWRSHVYFLISKEGNKAKSR